MSVVDRPVVHPSSMPEAPAVPDEPAPSRLAVVREMVGELIQYRELLWQMTVRDLRVRFPTRTGQVQAVDGVSLTVAARLPDAFTVALIPHTMAVTTLGPDAVGRAVNLEVDVVAKYVESLAAPYGPPGKEVA